VTLAHLFGVTLAALVAATAAGQILRLAAGSPRAAAAVGNANLRIASWWVLWSAAALAFALGRAAISILFAALSWQALREFAGPGAPSGGRERRAGYLAAGGAALTAAQFWLVWAGRFALFAALIPAASLILLAAGKRRMAAGLMVCVYGFSHAPALLMADIPGYDGGSVTLLFYFLFVVQLSDVLQYLWGKLAGRRPIAPRISPNKTWEGFIGGLASAIAVGTALAGATPFRPWEAVAICAAATLAGFGGGLALSAVKRRRGIKDFGTVVAGHGGVLDRIDSLCFSAPVFFYTVKTWYAA
jgi:phosphatidate cytidylyltransferase